jgi:Curlin associated repeat
MKNIFATAASVLVLGFAMPVLAQSNLSDVQQIGVEGQTATVDQYGNLAINSSGIYQGLYYGASAGNKAEVKQAGTKAIANNSIIFQDGYDNVAKVDQSGDGKDGDSNSSYISQYGSDNKVEVLQGDLVTDNTSWVSQYGEDNKAKVKQGGGEGGNLVNYSSIDQSGAGNRATVEQGGNLESIANTSFVTQSGSGNTATVNQH